MDWHFWANIFLEYYFHSVTPSWHSQAQNRMAPGSFTILSNNVLFLTSVEKKAFVLYSVLLNTDANDSEGGPGSAPNFQKYPLWSDYGSLTKSECVCSLALNLCFPQIALASNVEYQSTWFTVCVLINPSNLEPCGHGIENLFLHNEIAVNEASGVIWWISVCIHYYWIGNNSVSI